MWLKRTTHYLLRHRWQALALTFVSTFVPVIGILGILIAALITLVRGVVEGSLFMLAATMPYLISFYISTNQEVAVPMFVWAALGVAVASNVLTWVFASVLRKQMNWSQLLQLAALLGVLVVSVVHLCYPQVADWWGTQLQENYIQAASVTGMLKNVTPNASEAQVEAISVTKQYATGLMVGAIIFNALLQLMLARWWQVRMFHSGSLRRELYGIHLSKLAGILFVIGMGLAYFGNAVALDIMPVVYMLFCSAGLSLSHCLLRQMHVTSAWFWLTLLYIVLLFAMPTSILIISFVAFLDVWIDWRKRLGRV